MMWIQQLAMVKGPQMPRWPGTWLRCCLLMTSHSPQGLQQALHVTHAWCCKWRLKASSRTCCVEALQLRPGSGSSYTKTNVGLNKSAVMLFAP